MEEVEKDNLNENAENNLNVSRDSGNSGNFAISGKTVDDLDNSREIENLKKIEAALFISGRWLSMQDLVMLTDLNPILLRQLIEKLKESYGESSATEIIDKDNAWKMDVKPEYVGMINKLATGTAEFTKSEQETLAVIAYKQPVKQSVLIKIRGNKAYEHVKNFVSLGLVKAKKAGHTHELALSEDFYDYFHVGSQDDAIHVLGREESGEEKG